METNTIVKCFALSHEAVETETGTFENSRMVTRLIFSLQCQFHFTSHIIVYSAPSCASQPISLHRNLNFWPT